MNNGRQSIAIDMDGVIADTVAQFLTWYEREHGVRLERSVFDNTPESEALPNGALYRYVTTKGFFRDVPVMKGAVKAVQQLMRRFDVYIVSAAMEFPHSLYEKKCWLEDHFPFISWTNIVFCGSKSIIGTDYLIDDHLKNLDNFGGQPILFTAGHNLQVKHHVRVNNWPEAIAYFK